MTQIPTITIYVRHSAGCKYETDESAKRCDCRKWLRWTQDGLRQRRKANTRPGPKLNRSGATLRISSVGDAWRRRHKVRRTSVQP